ncbi:MAG: EAL domain-containing protein [Lachnospiraceae bacterium]|nr:EAL domain-containing protein [Lachnospiraceae bacterium]
MGIRINYSVLFSVLALVLLFCMFKALKSQKPIGKAVAFLDVSFLPALIGNIIIVCSDSKLPAVFGYYLYFLGMNTIMLAMVNFTNEYCQGIGGGNGEQKPTVIYIGLWFDMAQMLFNPFFGHAFDVEKIEVEGAGYYQLVPYWGQTVHRVIVYLAFGCVMLIFTLGVLKTTKIYREKFSVILVAMICTVLWQTFYIFSRTPIDRSMIGFGLCGILIFYLALYYRPLRLLDRLLSDIVSQLPEALYVFDPEDKCIWINDPGKKLIDVDEKSYDIVPRRFGEVFGDRDHTPEHWTDTQVVGIGDEARYYYIQKHNIYDDKGRMAGSVLAIQDTTEEKRKVKQELYESHHDSMTGLYTKQYLFENIRRIIDQNKDTAFVVIFVDVKNFKIVNDIFGSDFGDKALIQVAEWITKNMTDKCLYGRLAGDTFGVFMPKNIFVPEKAERDLENFVVKDGAKEHQLLIHLGVYEVVERDIDVSVMFDRAHLSISRLKDDYKNHVVIYDNNIREKVMMSQKISSGLREAIDTMQLRPYLQPITDMDGKVVGAEALARWIHPVHGFMSPAEFIPVFEKNGMIVDVDRHMWRTACKILASWKGKHDDVFISVNISPKDFYFIDVVEEIMGLVKEYDIKPVNLRLEITESVMMNVSEDRMKILEEFRRLGFIVEMDDFGSGYSSLNLLKEMPVDVLKIDMRFLSGDDGNGRSSVILRNVIRLADELDIDTLTEGVETGDQHNELSHMGCKLFQGYYFAKPMPVDDFEKFAFSS